MTVYGHGLVPRLILHKRDPGYDANIDGWLLDHCRDAEEVATYTTVTTVDHFLSLFPSLHQSILSPSHTHKPAEAVVPFLNTVLGRMLPMMGAAKYENMQWVFSNG